MLILIFAFVIRTYGGNFTVSGFSSGAFFAHQLHVAYSKSIHGVGIIAGGPYYCTLGTYPRTQTPCRFNGDLINLNTLTSFANKSASFNLIDDLKNIQNSQIYIFSGQLDSLVHQSSVKTTENFYLTYIKNKKNMLAIYDIPAEHGWVTDNYGNPCNLWSIPGIINCGYDMAGEMLGHLYGKLLKKSEKVDRSFISFEQADYVDVLKAGLGKKGWIYMPDRCRDVICRVHLVFHGCLLYDDAIGDVFVKRNGVNEWAEGNGIIVIYPQTTSSLKNPFGCWDYWGYTNPNFPYKSGLQMQAVFQMAQSPPFTSWS